MNRLTAIFLIFLLGKTAMAWDPQSYKRPADAQLKDTLNPTQYAVSCEGSTEPPFNNAYWDNERPGIYVDVISGEPLFSSLDKFNSKTGWPSFTRPLSKENITTETDKSHNMVRTEVRSKHGKAHLGHVFDDGPGIEGKRYCINSASLLFIPVEDLDKKGYSEYRKLFDSPKLK